MFKEVFIGVTTAGLVAAGLLVAAVIFRVQVSEMLLLQGLIISFTSSLVSGYIRKHIIR
jgi:hypothetical protein